MAHADRSHEHDVDDGPPRLGNLELRPNDPAIAGNPEPPGNGKMRQREIRDAIVTAVRESCQRNNTEAPKGYFSAFERILKSQGRLVSEFLRAYMEGNEATAEGIMQTLHRAAMQEVHRGNADAPRHLTRNFGASVLDVLAGRGIEAIDVRRAAARQKWSGTMNPIHGAPSNHDRRDRAA